MNSNCFQLYSDSSISSFAREQIHLTTHSYSYRIVCTFIDQNKGTVCFIFPKEIIENLTGGGYGDVADIVQSKRVGISHRIQ